MKDKTNSEIVALLTMAMNEKNQTLINKYAYELATRLYMPSVASNFEELLEGFGYKQDDSRQITTEEYMRGRNKNE